MEEGAHLSTLKPFFLVFFYKKKLQCIGIVDGTFVKIRKPWNNLEHSKWFNGHKNMCCMHNTIVVSHEGYY